MSFALWPILLKNKKFQQLLDTGVTQIIGAAKSQKTLLFAPHHRRIGPSSANHLRHTTGIRSRVSSIKHYARKHMRHVSGGRASPVYVVSALTHGLDAMGQCPCRTRQLPI
jgi:hypothetical protein